MQQQLAARWGEPGNWPRDADAVLLLLDGLIERNLVDPAARKSVAMLFPYAEYLVPAGDLDTLARGQAARLVRFLRWAQNPLIKQVNMAFCLIVDRLAELNDRLVESPHVAAIEVPLPDRDARCRFTQAAAKEHRPGRPQRFLRRAACRHVERPEPRQSERGAVAGRLGAEADRRQRLPRIEEDGHRAAVPRAGRIRRARPQSRPCRRPDRAPSSGCRKTPSGSPAAGSTWRRWAT